jgi:hypothetical protein
MIQTGLSSEVSRGRGILDDMTSMLGAPGHFLRGALPYPDLVARWRVRRRAAKLITLDQWPGEGATGMDAAQLSLLRMLWLQRLTRSAVGERRFDDAALLARAGLETCIVGLYCLHSGVPIAHLSAAGSDQPGRPVSYLSDTYLGSASAIDGAVDALSDLGPDLSIRDLALWLEREQELIVAARLYRTYYVPLSHLFAQSYGFALMRHVHPDGTLNHKPSFPWTGPSAARLADACTGLLAANIADQSGAEPGRYLVYATAHLDRLMTPAMAFTVKGALRSVSLADAPRTLRAVLGTQRRASSPGRALRPAEGNNGARPPADRDTGSRRQPGGFDHAPQPGPAERPADGPASAYPEPPGPAGYQAAAAYPASDGHAAGGGYHPQPAYPGEAGFRPEPGFGPEMTRPAEPDYAAMGYSDPGYPPEELFQAEIAHPVSAASQANAYYLGSPQYANGGGHGADAEYQAEAGYPAEAGYAADESQARHRRPGSQ